MSMAAGKNKSAHLQSCNPAQWRADYMLVQQYLHGSQSAWDTLYQQAYPGALRFLSKLPCMYYLCFDDKADILSESFLRCQMRADTFQGRSSFLTWVCGFIKYVALNIASKRISEEQKMSALGYLHRAGNFTSSPETILLQQERDHYLWTAYRTLPPYHQVLIGYLVLKKYSYWEAQSVTRLTLKAQMENELPHSLAILKYHFLTLYHI